MQAGYRTMVDVDLEKFFHRFSHDILMDRVSKRVADKRVLRLIHHYPQAGILAHGVHSQRVEDTPQAGPLSWKSRNFPDLDFSIRNENDSAFRPPGLDTVVRGNQV